MRVVFSSLAVTDLRRISQFIAQDNPSRAVSFVAELRETALRLADLPQGFPIVPRYERHGIRRRSWKGYGILYSALPDRVFVHRIIGPGQDLDRVLRLS
ncbi:type II toxin-antitoxin system RelE/ParE family toxin [Sphingomonas sp. CGMCC 1.13654]|uniref:Type II toxin-antitoxin system RelE/ParE family toxin n=1 Tax=Sphingomonas chungangi TaxID=2683589 RepID=A0A838LC18_9SPHN|nr:type II toxin-antitoxin system RelE/ParE family toxin [Sphingomonas chungangi]MVW55952.1 type II toxin-antitoxin system RelE/ParE family toxin [Sphingomonas chungangi]